MYSLVFYQNSLFYFIQSYDMDSYDADVPAFDDVIDVTRSEAFKNFEADLTTVDTEKTVRKRLQ